MVQRKAGRIRELDGWRGVSLLLVVAHHTLIYAFPAAVEHFYLLHHLFRYAGQLGVRIFFVISGFVITRLLILEEREYGSISLKGFYTRRFFRIIPVFYLLVLSVCILSWLRWTPVTRDMALLSALFLTNLNFWRSDWFLGHSWSLAVEEQFYLVFPLFWVISSPRRRPWLLFATLLVFLSWGVLFQWGILTRVLAISAISGFSCINTGALLAVFEPHARKLAAKVHPVAALLVAAFLLVRPMPFGRLANSLYVLSLPLGVALVLMYTVSRKGWASSLLNTAGIQWVGLISYSAYLWQELFTGQADSYGSPTIARIFHGCLPLLFLVAAASFYWIERPCTRLGRKLSARLMAQKPFAAGFPTRLPDESPAGYSFAGWSPPALGSPSLVEVHPEQDQETV